MTEEFAPVTPGEMLAEEFLAECGLTKAALAEAIGVPVRRVSDIVANRRRIDAETALRLSLFFGNSPQFWMNLQSRYDLKVASKNLDSAEAARIKSRRAA